MKTLRHLRSTLAAALLICCIAPLHAQTRNAPAIDARLKELVSAHTLSGAVTLVASPTEILHHSAVGLADIASARPMRTDDLFWIASMTKPMTAVCVLMLADEGRLSIEDPVEKHLPDFKTLQLKDGDRLIPPARPITVRDLLTHTSGLANVNAPAIDSTLAQLTALYAREPLQFPPGSKWAYCNPGINTLGRIVEVLSGTSFADFLQTRVLDPLQMRDTTFWPSEKQRAHIAKSYKSGTSGALEETDVYLTKGGLSNRQRTAYPAGGLFSTARDAARFYQMMLNNGALDGKRLLKPETAALMTRTQTGDIKTGFVDGMSWGLGFQVVKEPTGITSMLSAGTFGHGGAYGTQSWADPKKNLVYILMIQRAGLKNGDASEMRQAFQESAAAAFAK